jgi:hypothetical protein
MKRSVLFTFLVALFLFNTVVAFAQKNDISGTWVFKDQQGISGRLYINGSPKQVTVKQDGGGIKLESITSTGDKDTTTTESFGSNNLFETKTPRGRKKVITLKWSDDGKSFKETTNIYSLTDSGKLDFKNTDTWAVDNGELILDRENENYTNGEIWESKATFEKQ